MFTIEYLPTHDILHSDTEAGAYEAVSALAEWNFIDPVTILPDFWYLLHDFPEGFIAIFSDFCIREGGDYHTPFPSSPQLRPEVFPDDREPN